MSVTASVIVFLLSAIFAIPGAIAAALFVRVAWKRYWKSAAFIAALYGLNLVLSLVFKGAYRFRAWDVFMLWFIVDAMLLSSWVELLRKRVGDLAGKSEE